MPTAQTVTGRGPGSVNTIVRHLWTPLLESGLGRVVVGRHAEPGWQRLHSFTLQPFRNRPKLLVSDGRGRAVGRSLVSYRHLRTPPSQVGRLLVAGKVASGINRADDVVTVETREPALAAEVEPISIMERIVGQQLLAVVGIRDSANGKATLQLFDRAGHPASYAKLAWNAHTSAYVRTEVAALREVSFARADTYVPRLVADGTFGEGLPYLVTEPLPPSVRRVAGADDLSPFDVASLFHTVRRGPLRETAQFQGVLTRLGSARRAREDTELASLTGSLVDGLSRSDVDLPVMARWHGDLVPWNSAVDRDGKLWLWDWESSEEDAIGGLDVLHWMLNAVRLAAGTTFVARLQEAGAAATDALHVLGMRTEHRAIATAGYALTFAERNWSLAVTNGGWGRHRVGREATVELLRFGLSQLTR